MSGPLQGIRVIDLTTVAMGPWATQTLGDMGADVIKVEAPAGDHFRVVPPGRHPQMGATFLNLNRNKRSIVLDLKSPDDMAVLADLLASADVFVCNVRPQSLRKLGLDYPSLAARHPRLIYCGAYGFSERGPYAGRPAYDDIIQAMSGLAHLQGANNGGVPSYVNTIVADKITGLTLTASIAMALYERERSGLGQAIEVPMFETMVAFNLVEHLSGATFVPGAGDMGYDRVLSEHRRPYRTRDGFIGLLPYTNSHWLSLFRRVGRDDLAEHPHFRDAPSRARHVDEVYGVLADLVAQRSTQEWIDLLSDCDIPFTPVKSLTDLLDDPHLRAVGFFHETGHPSEGPLRTLGIPVTFSRTPGALRRPAPTLDEHGAEIRRELEAGS
ncbi:MAG TPA: CoA transferase [Quisquiliibacterium sp.]|nr:CoA transferase [Quisquiliibacterium sp.]